MQCAEAMYTCIVSNVYLYRFEWMKDYKHIGACHTSDVQLLFGAKGLEGMDISMGKTESETLNEGIPMRRMWTEFAKSGDVKEKEIKCCHFPSSRPYYLAYYLDIAREIRLFYI